jgi:hypothetical protein
MPNGFSVVVPIAERDAELVPRTLPSWLSLGSPDVVICVDEPASRELLGAIEGVVGGDGRVRVIRIPANPAWRFRHAFTRREGFRAAEFDRILTGDIDIVVNVSCLRAVEMVGVDGVGLVSLGKRRGGGTLGELVRNSSKRFARLMRNRTFFTGLYALYRPYWLDSEDQDQLRGVQHPHAQDAPTAGAIYLGEDVILRNAMLAKHKVVYLPDVGGTDLRISLEDRAPIQAKTGLRYYADGKPMGYVLAQSLMYGRGTLMGTYADRLSQERGWPALLLAYLGSIRYIVRRAEGYFLRRVSRRL